MSINDLATTPDVVALRDGHVGKYAIGVPKKR
jgi:hypothetical protein